MKNVVERLVNQDSHKIFGMLLIWALLCAFGPPPGSTLQNFFSAVNLCGNSCSFPLQKAVELLSPVILRVWFSISRSHPFG